MRNQLVTRHPSGFSLLELALTLGVVGAVMTGLWQLMGMSGQVRDATAIAGQAQALAAASQQYIISQRTTLLALPALANLNSMVRIKVFDTDTGATATSLAGLGFIPASFRPVNSYGQTYQLYVRREDGGMPGVADAGDSLTGLLLTTGGRSIPDTLGARISGMIGAGGGFMYLDENAAAPSAASFARGTTGSWRITLADTGWAGLTTTATAGRVAILTNLITQNISGAGSGGGAGGGGGPNAQTIDELSDGATNYSTRYNLYMGNNAGADSTTGQYNTAIGIEALRSNTAGSYNTAFGYRAMLDTAGSYNTAIGSNAYNGQYFAGNNSGNRNTAMGTNTLNCIEDPDESDNTAIGHTAGNCVRGSDLTIIGESALSGSTSTPPSGTGLTVVGKSARSSGNYNTMIGGLSGGYNIQGHGNRTVAIGHRAGYRAEGTDDGVYIGAFSYPGPIFPYQTITGDSNIAIGAYFSLPLPANSYQLNIGNFIHGLLTPSAGSINLGGTTFTTGVSFDVGTKTDSARLAKGTMAQRPACVAGIRGAMRWNNQTKSLEVCSNRDDDGDGNLDWYQIHLSGTVVADPGVPGIGYIVATAGKWDGGLGGTAGAHAKCFSDLSANNWKGKATAVAAGKLTAPNVQAVLWSVGGSCDMPAFTIVPNAVYAYAVSGKPTMGGATTVIDAAGNWPTNLSDWTAPNYLDGQFGYWTRSINCSSSACNNWSTSSSSQTAGVGMPGTSYPNKSLPISWGGDARTGDYLDACDAQYHLLCIVGP